jgi:hypothetical protein
MGTNRDSSQTTRFWPRKPLIAGLFVALCLAAGSPAVAAANPETIAAATSSPAVAAPVAACIALDASGSNFAPDGHWPASDPGPISARAGASEALAALLGGDRATSSARLAVVFFGQETLRIPSTDVTSSPARAAFGTQVEKLAQVDLGWTRLTAGLEDCRAILTASGAGTRRLLVVISDFVAQDADPHYDFAAQQAAITTSLLPALTAAHITVSGIGYGAAVRSPHSPFAALLANIASATGGQSVLVDPAQDSILTAVGGVLAHFLGTTFQAGSAQTGSADSPLSFTVSVPPDTAQAVFTIEHSDLSPATFGVTAPDGTVFAPIEDPADWNTGAGFVQFSQAAPAAGSWTVQVQGDGLFRLDVWLRAISPAPVTTSTPTPTPTPTPSPTPTPTPTPSPTPTPAGLSTPLGAPSSIPTPGATETVLPALVAPVSPGSSPTSAFPVSTPPSTPATAFDPLPLAGGLLLLLVALIAGLGAWLWIARATQRRPPVALVGSLTIEEPDGSVHDLSLHGTRLLIGAAAANDICLADPTVAPVHLELTTEDGPWSALVRLTPRDGEITRNGEPVPRLGVILADGDELRLGHTSLLYRHLSV